MIIASTTPNLQAVTDMGAVTTDSIEVGGAADVVQLTVDANPGQTGEILHFKTPDGFPTAGMAANGAWWDSGGYGYTGQYSHQDSSGTASGFNAHADSQAAAHGDNSDAHSAATTFGANSSANCGGIANTRGSFASGIGANTYLVGQQAFATHAFITAGDAQSALVHFAAQTFDATPTELLNLIDASRYTPPTNGAQALSIKIIAQQDDHTTIASWRFELDLASPAGVAAIDTPTLLRGSNAPGWGGPTFSVSGGSLVVTVIGAAATNINWLCSIASAETIN